MKRKTLILSFILIVFIVSVLAGTLVGCSNIKSLFEVNATNLADYANFTYSNGDNKINFSLKASGEAWVKISWDSAVVFNEIFLYESGNNVTGFEIYVNNELVSSQDGIGKMRNVYVGTTTATSVMVKVTSCKGTYKLTDIGIYNLSRNRDFHSTAFVRLNEEGDPFKDVDLSLIKNYTDYLIYPLVTFDSEGNLNVNGSELAEVSQKFRSFNLSAKLNLVIIPRPAEGESDNDVRHNALKDHAEDLAKNIARLLKGSGFDGAVLGFDFSFGENLFDYGTYNEFIEILRREIMSPYEIGVFINPDALIFNKTAKRLIDNFYVITPNLNDNSKGTFSETVCETLETLKDSDLPQSKTHLTIPFYSYDKENETLYKYCDYAEKLGKYGNTVTLDDGAALRFAGYTFVKDMTAFCYDYGIAGILSVCPHYDVEGDLSLASAIKEAMR